jgi:biotin carboxyl carrier protein
MAKTRSTKSESKTNSSDMKTTEIRDLIEFISKTGLNEVNVETKELKLHVKREPDQKVFKSSPVQSMSAPVQATPQVTTQHSNKNNYRSSGSRWQEDSGYQITDDRNVLPHVKSGVSSVCFGR